jgi:hypothetical protein
MRKIICLLAVVLMIASVAYAAGITTKDLAGLKGTWQGSLDFGMVGASSGSAPCKLEILNDSVPVQAKLTIWNIPDAVAQAMGISGGDHVLDSSNGVITTRGTLMWSGSSNNFFEVSMGGEKKLKADYWFRTVKGSASLKKK